MSKFTFIDAFAGLGGFHVGLTNAGGRCVGAIENDVNLQDLYRRNFGIKPFGDIAAIDIDTLPDHDVLTAGFPCQAFSKAGHRMGFDDERGRLFGVIPKMLKAKRPKWFILENVKNLVRHDGGRTMSTILSALHDAGYDVDYALFSPHVFGVPHKRERVFIVGVRHDVNYSIRWPDAGGFDDTHIDSVLDKEPTCAIRLPDRHIATFDAWNKIVRNIPPTSNIPARLLANAFDENHEPDMELPPYARKALVRSRDFYQKHYDKVDASVWDCVRSEAGGLNKLDYQGDRRPKHRDIWQHIIQVRMSGVRVALPNYSPSLVTLPGQVPIIGWKRRYMTLKECARLQGLDMIRLPDYRTRAIMALGNSVSALVVEKLARALIR